MKIIFCGPPHSGKSVFVANLIDKLPTDAYTIIRACPDGEGNWSNNEKQNETMLVRKKGKFDQSFVDDVCKAIDNQTNKIVLVDVGGVMSKENEQVFKHCDSFVVISGDEKSKQEWLKFGQKLGLECIGSIDSSLEGQEKIYSRKPYLQGKIVGLERGKILESSSIIKGMVSDIIEKSKYGEKAKEQLKTSAEMFVDDTQLGFELGYGRKTYSEIGIPIRQVRWDESAVPKIYEVMSKKIVSDQPIKINGIRANFVLSAICKVAKQKGVEDVRVYDVRTKSYVPVRNLPKKRGLRKAEGLEYNVIESKNNVFLDVDIVKEQYSLEDYKKCVLPKIEKEKNLYISGRLPLWLQTSISNSYDVNKIFTFQPGKGFTCISSVDEKELGAIADGVDGINVNQYFEDKKEKSNAPVVITNGGALLRIKKWFEDRGKGSNNSKYLDENVKANVVVLSEQNRSGEKMSLLRSDLKKSHGKNEKRKSEENYNNFKNEDNSERI